MASRKTYRLSRSAPSHESEYPIFKWISKSDKSAMLCTNPGEILFKRLHPKRAAMSNGFTRNRGAENSSRRIHHSVLKTSAFPAKIRMDFNGKLGCFFTPVALHDREDVQGLGFFFSNCLHSSDATNTVRGIWSCLAQRMNGKSVTQWVVQISKSIVYRNDYECDNTKID